MIRTIFWWSDHLTEYGCVDSRRWTTQYRAPCGNVSAPRTIFSWYLKRKLQHRPVTVTLTANNSIHMVCYITFFTYIQYLVRLVTSACNGFHFTRFLCRLANDGVYPLRQPSSVIVTTNRDNEISQNIKFNTVLCTVNAVLELY